MKKEYFKPVLCIEHYMLSEAIAACGTAMNVDTAGGCDFFDNQLTSGCSAFEVARPPYTIEAAPSWGDNSECNCYNGPSSGPVTDFFAGS